MSRLQPRLRTLAGTAFLLFVIAFLVIRDFPGQRWVFARAAWILPAVFGLAIVARVIDELLRHRRGGARNST